MTLPPFRSRTARPGRVLAPALLFALGLSGCASLPFQSSRGAAELLEKANLAGQQGDWPGSYRYAKQLHLEHPDSEESEKAYDMAAFSLRKMWFKTRYRQPDSPWQTEEPEFMFGWLATYCEGDEFPQRKVNKLLRAYPTSFFRRFEQYAEGDPRIGRWGVRMYEDNGRILAVRPKGAELPET